MVSLTLKYWINTTTWTANDLGESGGCAIAEALKTNSSVTKVDIYGKQQLKRWGAITTEIKQQQHEQWTRLAMREHVHLPKFWKQTLQSNGSTYNVGNHSNKNNKKTWSHNKSMTQTGDRISSKGACALAEALKTNTTIIVLSLIRVQQQHSGTILS